MDVLENLPNVGPAVAAGLRTAGFTSIEDLAEAEPGQLVVVKGVGPITAAAIVDAAQSLLGHVNSVGTSEARGVTVRTDRPATKPLESSEVENVESGTATTSGSIALSKSERSKLRHRLNKAEKSAKKARKKSNRKSGAKRKKHLARAVKLDKIVRKLKRQLD